MTASLSEKTILLTGATEGIGKAAAFALAGQGARLTLVGRNREKTEQVVGQVKQQTGNDRVDLLLADLSEQAQVRRVAQEFRQTHDRLDVLVNNAGAYFTNYQRCPDGLERTFAVNHLAYFLLTQQLWPLLEKTPGARVVSTSSGAHQSTRRLQVETLAHRDGRQAGFAAYGDSKLANILFTRALAKRLPGVAVNCFHPGFVRTGIAQNNADVVARLFALAGRLFGRTPQKGAETLVWLASSEEAARFTGEYFFDCKPKRPSRLAQDDALAEALWQLSEKLCADK